MIFEFTVKGIRLEEILKPEIVIFGINNEGRQYEVKTPLKKFYNNKNITSNINEIIDKKIRGKYDKYGILAMGPLK